MIQQWNDLPQEVVLEKSDFLFLDRHWIETMSKAGPNQLLSIIIIINNNIIIVENS